MKRPAWIHTVRLPPRPCLVCRKPLDAATGASTDPADPQPRPAPGDVTVCAYCDTPLVFTDTGFRFATDADLDSLDPPLRTLITDWIQQRKAPRQ